MSAITDTKKVSRDQFCVTTTGACRPNVLTFGCRGNMLPTCWQLSQPSHWFEMDWAHHWYQGALLRRCPSHHQGNYNTIQEIATWSQSQTSMMGPGDKQRGILVSTGQTRHHQWDQHNLLSFSQKRSVHPYQPNSHVWLNCHQLLATERRP